MTIVSYPTRAEALAGSFCLGEYVEDLLANTPSPIYLKIPVGFVKIGKSLSLAGRSNIHLDGFGPGITTVVAASTLNGSDNIHYNDVIHALNWTPYDTVNGGYPNKNIRVSNITVDCWEQNFSGITPEIIAGKLGYSLAGIEIMNVDDAAIENVEILGAYGNGACITSADPRLYDSNGVRVGVYNPVMRNVQFRDCLRGLLPQYWGDLTPDGITGTVIQVGASVGGNLTDILIERPSGPAIDRFNCESLVCQNIIVNGYGLYPVGCSNTSATPFQQAVGTIRSDFGMIDCTLKDVKFINTGGIFDIGNPVSFFQNGNIPTPGPQRCTYDNIRYKNVSGARQISHPPLGNAGELIHHTFGGYVHNYPIVVKLIGGSGVSGIIYRNDPQHPVGLEITNGQFVLRKNDMVQLNWTTKPTGWTWKIVPNYGLPEVSIQGGSGQGITQYARDNIISNISGQTRPVVQLIDNINTTVLNVSPPA